MTFIIIPLSDSYLSARNMAPFCSSPRHPPNPFDLEGSKMTEILHIRISYSIQRSFCGFNRHWAVQDGEYPRFGRTVPDVIDYNQAVAKADSGTIKKLPKNYSYTEVNNLYVELYAVRVYSGDKHWRNHEDTSCIYSFYLSWNKQRKQSVFKPRLITDFAVRKYDTPPPEGEPVFKRMSPWDPEIKSNSGGISSFAY